MTDVIANSVYVLIAERSTHGAGNNFRRSHARWVIQKERIKQTVHDT